MNDVLTQHLSRSLDLARAARSPRHHDDESCTPEEIASWCERYSRTRDPELRDVIIAHHQWLVAVCARRMRRHGEPLEDLAQAANVALIQALERFDPEFGVEFRTYASATILGSLRRYYRDSWRLRVPRRLQELHLRVSRAIDHLTAVQQRSPTVDEIAHHLRIDPETVIEALEVGSNYTPASLSQPGTRDQLGIEVALGRSDPWLESSDDRTFAASLLKRLPPRQRTILNLRFFEGLTQAEIGEQLGISQVHVSRLMRRALTMLRHLAGDGETLTRDAS